MANGFYGSLSKIQKINFQFDRIFPNRATMDAEAQTGYYIKEGTTESLDPVFNGRYVLIDYHEGDIVNEPIRIGYFVNGVAMAAPGIPFNEDSGVSVEDGTIVIILGEYNSDQYTAYKNPKRYAYPNFSLELAAAVIENDPDEISVYERNLIIDGKAYPNVGRGWDSTVWQKVYQNGKSTYVMIAELNAFSPTIAIAPEAPHQVPLNPYIGTDSTLNFYRFHLESSAGFRIKGADNYSAPILTKDNSVLNVALSKEVKPFPSDVYGNIAYYDGIGTSTLSGLPLAIYYNKKGLNKFISASNALAEVKADQKWAISDGFGHSKDSIQFNYSGRSGKQYSDGSFDSVDTYELSMMLPSIGESISKMFDLVYGGNEYFNTDGLHLYYKDPETSIVENENADFTSAYFADENEARGFRNTDVYWNSKQGIRLYKKEYDDVAQHATTVFNANGLNTLAGLINTTHDLMGMIIRDYRELSLADEDVKKWDPTKIYYKDGSYYFKSKTYDWAGLTGDSVMQPTTDIYNQVHFLPINLVAASATNTENDDDVVLTSELNPNWTYFLDANHNAQENTHRRNILYRESWEEYPTIPDDEVFDSDKGGLFGGKYVNYIKVKSEKDLIEGAVYGIIAENSTEETSEDTPQANRNYYYYDTSYQYGVGAYLKETASLSEFSKGVYYDLTDVENYKVTKEFYIPNVYYVYNKITKKTKLATAENLEEYAGEGIHEYSNDGSSKYIFYRGVLEGDGTIIEEDTSVFDLARREVPTDRSSYDVENKILTIYTDTNHSTVVDRINFLSATDVTNANGIDTIEFQLGDSSIPVYYWTIQYTNIDKQHYYTKDDIFTASLDPTEYNIPKYKMKETDSSAQIWIPDPETEITTPLIDFAEGKYFYFYGGDAIFVLETRDRLRSVNGQGRNRRLEYYDFNLGSVRKIFQNAGGAYYKTVEGDYKVYPIFHIKDPTQENLTQFGKPLAGEVWQSAPPRFIPLGDINNFRVFQPNVYYDSPNGNKVFDLVNDNNHSYYERIGNIVGPESVNGWPEGMEWDDSNPPENEEVLGIRSVNWKAKKIDGMGEDINTMFGLILRVSQLLQSDDKITRDSTTVQGMFNQINDVLINLKHKGYYHAIEIENAQNEVQRLEAQSASTVKLKSDTNTVEFSVDENEDLNLNLAEQYRRWVVPNRETNSTTLSFKDAEDVTKSTISVDENGDMSINANTLTLTDGTTSLFTVTDSGLEYNGKPVLISENEDPISFGWDSQNKTFTVYSNGTPIIQIKKQEEE